ncbi:MAG: hypothetical protein CMO06_09340 [Thalassospira sp.]|nr:hypothetical protein [Thalassospira sp.]|tara:strand:+ start:456 stop:761 length:306 start_codon:yes stop_codon:yes gene_type:complete
MESSKKTPRFADGVFFVSHPLFRIELTCRRATWRSSLMRDMLQKQASRFPNPVPRENGISTPPPTHSAPGFQRICNAPFTLTNQGFIFLKKSPCQTEPPLI